MGSGESTEHHHYHTNTVYQTPPEVIKVMDEQTEKLKEFEAEAMELHDPKLFQSNSTKLLDDFVEQLPSLNLGDIINKQTGENHIGFIGPISAGKTSMINVLFNKNLPIALGHCTEKCEVVHCEGNNVIWDVNGQNDDFKFYNPMNLSFVKGLDKCVILFDNDISMISNILKVVHKINPNNMIIVRTKVDQHSQFNLRTVEEEKVLDMKKVNDLLGVSIETYCVSSNNIMDDKERFDWDNVKEVLDLN